MFLLDAPIFSIFKIVFPLGNRGSRLGLPEKLNWNPQIQRDFPTDGYLEDGIPGRVHVSVVIGWAPHGIEGVDPTTQLEGTTTNDHHGYFQRTISVTSWDDPPSTYWVEGVDPIMAGQPTPP